MKFFKMLFLFIAVILFFGNISYSSDTREGKFYTMRACLAGILHDSNSTGIRVSKDTPNKVVGNLKPNGQFFVCEKKVTGTAGTYYLGWYTVK